MKWVQFHEGNIPVIEAISVPHASRDSARVCGSGLPSRLGQPRGTRRGGGATWTNNLTGTTCYGPRYRF